MYNNIVAAVTYRKHKAMDQTTVSPKELTISQEVHCHHCDADGTVEEKGLKLQQGGELARRVPLPCPTDTLGVAISVKH